MYVDGYVTPVPSANREAYIAHASAILQLFRDHGALRCVECWGDDVPHGKRTDFHMAVVVGPGEAVLFSWIEWPDKQTRDAGIAKLMADPRMAPENQPDFFDGKRLIYGGFAKLIDL